MNWLYSINQWLLGGEPAYMKLANCMRHDTLWITITVILDLSVAVGYGVPVALMLIVLPSLTLLFWAAACLRTSTLSWYFSCL